MVESAFAKAMELTTSRILQYLYVVILNYARLARQQLPAVDRDRFTALADLEAGEMAPAQVKELQRAVWDMALAPPRTTKQ